MTTVIINRMTRDYNTVSTEVINAVADLETLLFKMTDLLDYSIDNNHGISIKNDALVLYIFPSAWACNWAKIVTSTTAIN